MIRAGKSSFWWSRRISNLNFPSEKIRYSSTIENLSQIWGKVIIKHFNQNWKLDQHFGSSKWGFWAPECFKFSPIFLSIAQCQILLKHIQTTQKFPQTFHQLLQYRNKFHLLLAAASRSLTSLTILLICWLVFSSSFSWRFRFSRNSGESSKHSVNSNGCNPLITILLSVYWGIGISSFSFFYIFIFLYFLPFFISFFMF